MYIVSVLNKHQFADKSLHTIHSNIKAITTQN